MSIRKAIIAALQGQTKPISGRAVAEAAGLPYKVAIDALGRMLDVGTVVRFGRKYSSEWALAAHAAALPAVALDALEACWHGRPPGAPDAGQGGEAQATPRPASI